MQKYQTPFLEWNNLSFKEIENVEIEDNVAKVYYKTFFTLLRLPELTLKAFYTLLKADLN